LDVQRLEDRVGHAHRERLLDGRVRGERRDRSHVPIRVQDRPASPRGRHDEGERDHREDHQDQGHDPAGAEPPGRPVLQALDLPLQAFALRLELGDVVRRRRVRGGWFGRGGSLIAHVDDTLRRRGWHLADRAH
jgi:hypothetical protein